MNNPALQEFIKKIRPRYRPTKHLSVGTQSVGYLSGQVDKENSNTIDKAINLTLIVDGWTDVNHASLVNVAVFAGSPMFLKSVAPAANRHNAEFIVKTILDITEKTPADFKTVTNKSEGPDEAVTFANSRTCNRETPVAKSSVCSWNTTEDVTVTNYLHDHKQ